MTTATEVPIGDLDYAEILCNTRPLTVVDEDGTITETLKGADIHGRDIRDYERLLRTATGRRKLGRENLVVRLWASVREIGMTNPLICVRGSDGRLRAEIGNQRLAVARALMWSCVDVVVADSPKHAREIAKEMYQPCG